MSDVWVPRPNGPGVNSHVGTASADFQRKRRRAAGVQSTTRLADGVGAFPSQTSLPRLASLVLSSPFLGAWRLLRPASRPPCPLFFQIRALQTPPPSPARALRPLRLPLLWPRRRAPPPPRAPGGPTLPVARHCGSSFARHLRGSNCPHLFDVLEVQDSASFAGW